MAKCKLTMRDISRASGLSMFTVSRALSGAAGVSEASRLQIRKIAQEIGYVPNRAAQELRGVSRGQIALITAGTANAYYARHPADHPGPGAGSRAYGYRPEWRLRRGA